MSCCRKDWLVVFAYLGITLLFFYRFLTGSEILAFKDLTRYFYPLRYLMVEQVRAGILPLWNSQVFCGFPLLASLQVGFFYPLSVIYYLLPFNLAFNYYIILHYFLAACFMYALLRHFSLGRPAAFFGGLVWAFSGYLLSVSNMNTTLSSVIWLPLAVLFYSLISGPHPQPLSQRERGVNLVKFTIILALMFLGGEPTVLYVTVIFLFVYGLVFSTDRLKSAGQFILAIILAAGLVAIQLIPFLELANLSDRLVRTGFDLVAFRSFPPRELINFIYPFFFGSPAQTANLPGAEFQDWLLSPYLGIVPLFFAGIAIWRRDKLRLLLLISALVALFLAFGKYTLFYRLAYTYLPGISAIRFPVKFLFLVIFCLAILSAKGFERLFQASKRKFVLGLIVLAVLIDYFANTPAILIGASAKTFAAVTPNQQIIRTERGSNRFFYTAKLEEANRIIYGRSFNDALLNAKDNLAANWHIPLGLSDFYGYESVQPLGMFKYCAWLDRQPLEKQLKLLGQANVKYVASSEELRSAKLKLLSRKTAGRPHVFLYENRLVKPRAFFLPAGVGVVSIESYRPGRIEMRVAAKRPGLLFLSESFYPGWNFYVDGKKEKVLQAEEVFSAVKIAAGKHKVIFVYEPQSLKLGAMISALTLIILAVILFR